MDTDDPTGKCKNQIINGEPSYISPAIPYEYCLRAEPSGSTVAFLVPYRSFVLQRMSGLKKADEMALGISAYNGHFENYQQQSLV